MNEEQIAKLVEDKINDLSKAIEDIQSIIPALRCNIYIELDNMCFEIVDLLGNKITCLQEFNRDIQMDSIKRANGIEKVLKQYIIFGGKIVDWKERKKKLFISHSALDVQYVSKLVQLFEYLGFSKETMFCSSYSGYDIPLDEDIYDYLKKQFNEYELYIILVLSDNYYQSAASLNEMGAAWVLSAKQSAILLPGFDFKEIKGAVNPNRISIKMDQQDLFDLKFRLGQLRDKLLSAFELNIFNADQWERKRDEFIDEVKLLSIETDRKTNKKKRNKK